ncbi:MAG: hypothetical protein HOI95_07800, partial [Chromatiales bacterium]|nr:hypothetical protein [Chromatiales bacterium]
DVIDAIVAAELQSPDPLTLAERWGEIAEIAIERTDVGFEMPLSNATVRFVEATDGRPEGLGALDVRAADPDRALKAAESRCLTDHDGTIYICGTRFHLVS